MCLQLLHQGMLNWTLRWFDRAAVALAASARDESTDKIQGEAGRWIVRGVTACLLVDCICRTADIVGLRQKTAHRSHGSRTQRTWYASGVDMYRLFQAQTFQRSISLAGEQHRASGSHYKPPSIPALLLFVCPFLFPSFCSLSQTVTVPVSNSYLVQ